MNKGNAQNWHAFNSRVDKIEGRTRGVVWWLLLVSAILVAMLAFLYGDLGAQTLPQPMPPHPDLLVRPDGPAAVEGMRTAVRASVWQAGLNDPSDFDMPAHVARRKGVVDAVSAAWGSPPDPSFNMLVLLLRFRDDTATIDPTFFDDLCYGDTGRTSRTYWRDNSGGRLDIVTVDMPSAVGWQGSPESKAYYVNGNYGFGAYPHNSQRMVEDALTIAVAQGVNLLDYDNNNDRRPDGITVVHTGTGAEYSGRTTDMWSHKWMTRTSPLGVPVQFATVPEYWTLTMKMKIGVFVHEWGHVFGLPDLYDTDNSSRGLGRWALMSGGSWNGSFGDRPAGLCAWSRNRLGFADVTDAVVTGVGTYELGPLEDSGHVVRIWASGAPSKAYWLVSYRKGGTYDVGLPGAGVMIEAIDDARNGYNSYEWCRLDSIHHNWPNVRIVQWDDRCDLEYNRSNGDATDPWPAPAVFDAPRSDWYTGDSTGVSVTVLAAGKTGATVQVGTCDCSQHGVIADWQELVAVLFFGAIDRHSPTCARSDYDLNCDGSVDSVDLQVLIDRDYLGVPTEPCDACNGGA